MSTGIEIKSAGGSISQTQKIYVDSENGADVATNGNLSSPFLTPEYALTQINNTATITGNTNTNTTISGISDADNTTLEVGMYLSGTGIPFGTIIIAKGNEGSDANTVTLSKSATATASGLTLTWIKIYEVRLNGSFVVTSNLFKEGVYINSGTSKITWGAFNLFDSSTLVFKTPYKLLGNGDYFGTATTNKFFNTSNINQTLNFTLDIEFGNIQTVSTDYIFSIGVGQNLGFINIKGGLANAQFGKLGAFLSGTFNIDFNGYGLLYGLAFSFTTRGILKGRYQTPSAVIVVSGAYYTQSTADLNGSTSWTGYCTHRGVLSGSTQSLGGDFYILNRSNAGTLTGNGTVSLEGASSAFVNPTASTNLTLKSGGFALTFNSTWSGTITNYATLANGSNAGTGVFNNYGTFTTSGGNGFGSFSGTVNNYGTMTLMNFSSGAITFNNYGIVYGTTYGLNISNGGVINNYNAIISGNLSNGAALITVNKNGTLNNYGRLEFTNAADTVRTIVDMANGKLLLRTGSNITVANGKSPVRIKIVDSGTTTSTSTNQLIQTGQNFTTTVIPGCRVHNTTDDTWATVVSVDSTTTLTLDNDIMVSGETYNIYANPDVYYFNITSNCDGTTYGLLQSFDGIAPAPNDLVGGTLYENTNY